MLSILLQVLYFLQQGHVQLIGDYKARVIDVYGPDAFIAKAKARKLGKDGLPREVRDVNVPPPSSGQSVDLSQDDEEGAVDPDDEGLGFHFNRDDKGDHIATFAQNKHRARSANGIG